MILLFVFIVLFLYNFYILSFPHNSYFFLPLISLDNDISFEFSCIILIFPNKFLFVYHLFPLISSTISSFSPRHSPSSHNSTFPLQFSFPSPFPASLSASSVILLSPPSFAVPHKLLRYPRTYPFPPRVLTWWGRHAGCRWGWRERVSRMGHTGPQTLAARCLAPRTPPSASGSLREEDLTFTSHSLSCLELCSFSFTLFTVLPFQHLASTIY